MKAGLATSLSIAGVLATGGAALVLNSSILDTESSAKGSPAFATVVGIEAEGGITPLGDGATPGSVTELSAEGVADLVTGEGAPLVDPLAIASDAASANAAPPSPSGASTSGSGSSSSGSSAAGSSGAIKQTQAKLTATETSDVPSPTSVALPPATSTPVATPTTAPTAPTTTVAPTVEKQFKVGDAATITLVISGKRLLVKDILITPGSGYKVTNQMSRDGDDVRITLASPARVLEFSARLVNGQVVAAVSTPSSGNLTPPPPRRHHDDDDHHEEREEREHDDDHEEEEREGDHDDDD